MAWNESQNLLSARCRGVLEWCQEAAVKKEAEMAVMTHLYVPSEKYKKFSPCPQQNVLTV